MFSSKATGKDRGNLSGPEILKLGDEGVGGGLSVAGSSWDKEALAIQQVLLSFDGVGSVYTTASFSHKLLKESFLKSCASLWPVKEQYGAES
ncbi:hypothetical protein Tco_0917569 [Tanacetum coccineum]